MNHYQKLATVLVRGAGLGMVALGLFGLVYGMAFIASGTALSPAQMERFRAGLWWSVFGAVLFVLGRPLGRLLGHKIE